VALAEVVCEDIIMIMSDRAKERGVAIPLACGCPASDADEIRWLVQTARELQTNLSKIL
jgi:hypothetical protein